MLHENTIVLGDCLEVLRQLPDCSVDSVVTDPPYGLGTKEPSVEDIIHYLRGERLDTGGDFMGKAWDIPSVAVWKECFRVLKPGGHLLSFGGTRTFDLISLGLRAAGFENRDTIAEDNAGFQWKHGQGFPKSLNIGKAIDNSPTARRAETNPLSEFIERVRSQASAKGFTYKTLNEALGQKAVAEHVLKPSKSNATWPTRETFDGLKRLLDIGDAWDWLYQDVRAGDRPIIGRSTNGLAPQWVAQGQAGYKQEFDITAPLTLEASQWEGWGTALKPSWEPILVFRKPVEGTVAENVLKHGTGGMNIDGTRVRHSGQGDFEKHKAMVDRLKEQGGSLGDSWKNSSDLSGASEVSSAGRWPTNAVMVHAEGCKKVGTKKVKATSVPFDKPPEAIRRSGVHSEAGGHQTIGRVQPVTGHADSDGDETITAWECAPGCPIRALDEQSGDRPVSGRAAAGNLHTNAGKSDGGTVYDGGWGDNRPPATLPNDSGGASRFFPQFEAEQTTQGRWPPNAVMVHSDGCKKVGTKTLNAPVINRFTDGVKPFGDGAGHPFESTGGGTEEVVVWECVEGCPVRALDEQSGDRASTLTGRADPQHKHTLARRHVRTRRRDDNATPFTQQPGQVYADSGGASRFFPQFEGQVPPEAPFMYTGKATKREATLDGQVPNKHPTKKPLALMQWLVKLVTPKGGICLDPFVGSGTTAVAAIEEGMRFIGIERDPAYHADAVKRVGVVYTKEEVLREQEDVLEELFNGG